MRGGLGALSLLAVCLSLAACGGADGVSVAVTPENASVDVPFDVRVTGASAGGGNRVSRRLSRPDDARA